MQRGRRFSFIYDFRRNLAFRRIGFVIVEPVGAYSGLAGQHQPAGFARYPRRLRLRIEPGAYVARSGFK